MAEGVTVTWLGHGTFLLESAGKRFLIDPWIDGNPKFPEGWKDRLLQGVDGILVTHGHFDHVSGLVEVANATHAPILCMFDLVGWLKAQGIAEDQCTGYNKGGTAEVAGAQITMVPAQHSSTHADASGLPLALGEAVGFIVRLNDVTIYHTGDTCVFGDMRIWGELYQPDAVIMPIGGFFTMDPRQAAYAANLIGAPIVIPGHFGTFPVLKGTPAELRAEVGASGITVADLEPGASTVVHKRGVA